MNQKIQTWIGLVIFTAAFLTESSAHAHHVMDGRMPVSFSDGFLSGLGHPIIGLDHFAAVVAIGCLAAAHYAGASLVLGFVGAMMAGVGLHLYGTPVVGSELLVALTVVGLGAFLVRHSIMPTGAALALFAAVGLVHGYALGESIYGAERTPIYAYLFGLAIVQSAVALGAMNVARIVTRKSTEYSTLRLVGAGIAGIGIATLMQKVVSTTDAITSLP